MSTVGRRILLVDDDEQLVALLTMQLSKAGYQVVAETRPEAGLQAALTGEFDVVVLDIMMPRISGIEVCTALRAHGILTPILILSGQTETDVVVQGLNAGADDYLTKPFSDIELLARIRAEIRRNKRAFTTLILQRQDVVLDVQASVVQCADSQVQLTKKETLLLKRLMADSPAPVSRSSLLKDVWGIGSSHASNRLDVYIRRLRKKLEALGGGTCIHTVRNSGYSFVRQQVLAERAAS